MEVHSNEIARDVKETVRKLKAAQYTAAHPGEVCPPSGMKAPNPGPVAGPGRQDLKEIAPRSLTACSFLALQAAEPPEPAPLRAVQACAGRLGAAALSPHGAAFRLGAARRRNRRCIL